MHKCNLMKVNGSTLGCGMHKCNESTGQRSRVRQALAGYIHAHAWLHYCMLLFVGRIYAFIYKQILRIYSQLHMWVRSYCKV